MRAADLFRKYRQSINPPYSRKDLVTIGLTIFVLIAIPLTVLLALQARELRSRAAGSNAIEAESASLSGPATVGNDADASGGKYIRFGSGSSFQPTAPYYATFFYPWFQNQKTDGAWGIWNSNGHSAPQNWFSNYLPDVDTTAFDPASELYSSNDDAVFYWQLRKLAEAKQEVAISSWWGQGHKTDTAFRHIITDVMNRPDNPYPNLRWSLYYEAEGQGNPTVATIVNDLNYIKTNYSDQKAYLKVGGKPVVFVYADATDGADMASRWAQARSQTDFYVVLKVYSGYKSDPNQPDSWHQYAPAVRSDNQAPYSFAVSPGFWKDGEAVRLARNLTEFRAAVTNMVNANVTWKLTETWNEWGEGTAVEPGDQVIQTTSGNATLDPNGVPFKNQYIDALNQLLPALEQGTGAIATKMQPKIAGVANDPLITAAGDISYGVDATDSQRQQMQRVADLITSINPSLALALGDISNEDPVEATDYTVMFDQTWGRFKGIIRPVPGNHDYLDAGNDASDYFDYFGAISNPTDGYYSYDLGSWHIIAINSNCSKIGGCSVGSPQEKWLRADLEANKAKVCTLAYWHHPRFSSGQHGNFTSMEPIWQALYDYGADIVLNGHDHDYERFALQDPTGNAAPNRGIREFVVGTGGRGLRTFLTTQPNSEARDSSSHGVLKLTLHAGSYDWQFSPSDGSFTDSGSSNCVTTGTDSQPPTAPTNLVATAASAAQVDLSWTESTDDVGVVGYKIFRNGSQIATSPTNSYSDTSVQAATTYSYYVIAYDTAAHDSQPSNTASVTTLCASLPTDKGVATTTISLSEAGTYKIWSRVMAPDATNNSYWLQVDKDCGIVVGDAAIAANTWTWVDYKDGSSASKLTMSLSAGSHAVKMIGRETGLKLDRLIFTTDTTCVPTGTGDNCLQATTSYYVDCIAGDDSNSGTSEASAWKSLDKGSAAPLNPGDSILLKRGCIWTGKLLVSRSGTATNSIVIGAYGSGELPIIENSIDGTSGVDVSGSYITIENIYTRAIAPSTEAECDNNPKGWIIGFRLRPSSHHITIQNSKSTGNYAGVYIELGSNNNKILNNSFQNNNMMSPLDTTSGNDAGAFGILIHGTDNEIAYNTFSGHDACSYDYGRDGSDVEIFRGQRNKIHHNKSTNSNGFSELGGDSTTKAADNTYAYNLVNSSLAESHFLTVRGSGVSYGPTYRTKAYNNTVYFTGSSSQGVVCDAGCSSEILTLKNNILWANWKAAYADASFDEGYNIYWRVGGSPLVQGFNPSPTSKKVDPQFVDVASSNLHLKSTSPAINAGTNESVTAGFTTDLDGKVVPVGLHPDIGAFEAASSAKTGDLDGDNDVDISDLSILITNWGISSGPADIDNSGDVDIFDLSILLSNWGK